MNNWNSDKDYLALVQEILDIDEFKTLKNYKHHGDNRLDHSLRVSYMSYLKAKKKGLRYKEVARAGLLHDFYLVNNQKVSIFKRIKVLFTHPKISVENAEKYIKLNDLEKNIILSHMFPLYLVLPKSRESLLVNYVDDIVSIYERWITTFKKH